ncbi:MAG: hypothetical protein ACW99H_07090, partial [Candidatus Thorarchaeota archaeon]
LEPDFYYLYIVLRPVSPILTILVAVGLLGFLAKHESNLAYPMMFIYLLPEVVDLFYGEIDYLIRLGIITVLIAGAAITLLTVRRRARTPILLYIFTVVMIANSFVPYLLQIAFTPTFPVSGGFMELFAYIAPYMIFDTIFLILAILLFLSEVRVEFSRY